MFCALTQPPEFKLVVTLIEPSERSRVQLKALQNDGQPWPSNPLCIGTFDRADPLEIAQSTSNRLNASILPDVSGQRRRVSR